MKLSSIFGIFSSNSIDTMSFYKLYTKMRKWDDSRTYPYEYELPDAISFPEDFWKKVVDLYKQTRSDGYERAISVFWADGDLIVSSVIKGTKSSVTPKNKVTVRYSRSRKENYLTKEVFVDERTYSKRDVYYKKVPSQIEVRTLFNMHTHPPHPRDDGSIFYSFFSLQDLKSLVGSGAVITGMIGDKLWLLMRTNKTPREIVGIEQYQVNVEFLEKELHIGVYCGDFKQKLRRINPPIQN